MLTAWLGVKYATHLLALVMVAKCLPI